ASRCRFGPTSVQRRPLALDVVGILVEMDMRIDMIDPFQRNEVVLAVGGIALRQLDAAFAVEMVHGADMAAVCGTHFHVFANVCCSNHWGSPSLGMTPGERRTRRVVPAQFPIRFLNPTWTCAR